VTTDLPPLETIACPYCGTADFFQWALERGFATVRCKSCALLFVNPRPAASSIDAAVRTGFHAAEALRLNVVSRHSPAKVARYRKVLRRMFDDVWRGGRPIAWLDVGAGYGEIVEAVTGLAPPGSRVAGLEPMHPKAAHARARGLSIIEDYLRPEHGPVDVISVVDVFSHIPDFGRFLDDVKACLKPGGEVFIETGNLADLGAREEFPDELGVPDHLVFAGERHLRGYLERARFDVLAVERVRIDDLIHLAKTIVKKALGRPVTVALPYASRYRQLLLRARLRPLS
jgi:2-polyprenyl-3-methyl-5-hydroxy-6-metoxy-1,4-benzoquinol methylase